MEREKISQRIEKQPIMKVLLIFFICLVIGMAFYIKILGATNIGNLVEKDGYCKIVYTGKFSEKNKYCIKVIPHENETDIYFTEEIFKFTEEEFRDFCPQNKFFSKQFYSDCFNSGDARI